MLLQNVFYYIHPISYEYCHIIMKIICTSIIRSYNQLSANTIELKKKKRERKSGRKLSTQLHALSFFECLSTLAHLFPRISPYCLMLSISENLNILLFYNETHWYTTRWLYPAYWSSVNYYEMALKYRINLNLKVEENFVCSKDLKNKKCLSSVEFVVINFYCKIQLT